MHLAFTSPFSAIRLLTTQTYSSHSSSFTRPQRFFFISLPTSHVLSQRFHNPIILAANSSTPSNPSDSFSSGKAYSEVVSEIVGSPGSSVTPPLSPKSPQEDNPPSTLESMYRTLAIIHNFLEIQRFFSPMSGLAVHFARFSAPIGFHLLMVLISLQSATKNYPRLYASSTYVRLNFSLAIYAIIRFALTFDLKRVARPLAQSATNVVGFSAISGKLALITPLLICATTVLVAMGVFINTFIRKKEPNEETSKFSFTSFIKGFFPQKPVSILYFLAAILAAAFGAALLANPTKMAETLFIASDSTAAASTAAQLLQNYQTRLLGNALILESAVTLVLMDASNRSRLSATTFIDLSSSFIIASLSRIISMAIAFKAFKVIARGTAASALSWVLTLAFILLAILQQVIGNIGSNEATAKKKEEQQQ